jgi:hypothetical protein
MRCVSFAGISVDGRPDIVRHLLLQDGCGLLLDGLDGLLLCGLRGLLGLLLLLQCGRSGLKLLLGCCRGILCGLPIRVRLLGGDGCILELVLDSGDSVVLMLSVDDGAQAKDDCEAKQPCEGFL